MNEDHIKVTFSEPVPTRVLLEEDLNALETLSDLLNKYAKEQPGDPKHFNDTTRAAFLSIVKTINDRVKELIVDYSGERFLIMAKGRRKLALGLKKEPDIYIGSDYGLNFIDACRNFFKLRSHIYNYNERNNTACRRMLFSLPVKDIYKFESGIETTDIGYSVSFKLCNQTYKLAPEESRGDAELLHKMLNKTFENLLTLKNTRPK
jgi:hypothetical protein